MESKPMPDIEMSQAFSDHLIGQFVAKEMVVSAIKYKLRTQGLKLKTASIKAKKLVRKSLLNFKKDPEWSARLEAIFDGLYPNKMHEFIHAGSFAYRKHQKRLVGDAGRITFKSLSCEYVMAPKRQQANCMAPALVKVFEDKVAPTVSHERFLQLEQSGLLKSALIELETYNRPAYGVKEKWDFLEGQLPKKTVPASVTSKVIDENLLTDFIKDLRSTFSFKDEDSLAGYVAYLIHPFFSHLMRGLMPAYYFCGPTKSGKGYLSHGLPGILFRHDTLQSQYVKKLPESLNQMEVFAWSAKDAIYVIFDEIKNATIDQMKVVDALVTSDYLSARKLYSGYLRIPNDFVIALTAVNTTFTDETAGRLISIGLTESDPNAVGNFHRRWQEHGAILLATINQKISKLKLSLNKIPAVPNRRDGFSLLAFVLRECFEIETTFPIETFGNDFLDFLSDVYCRKSTDDERGNKKMRMSLKAVREAYGDLKNEQVTSKFIEDHINTSLAYGGSTKNHPAYKDKGYPAHDGNNYHIRFVVEGAEKRKFLYINRLSRNRG